MVLFGGLNERMKVQGFSTVPAIQGAQERNMGQGLFSFVLFSSKGRICLKFQGILNEL